MSDSIHQKLVASELTSSSSLESPLLVCREQQEAARARRMPNQKGRVKYEQVDRQNENEWEKNLTELFNQPLTEDELRRIEQQHKYAESQTPIKFDPRRHPNSE